MTHIIAGERVFLRPLEGSDAEIYRRWRADAAPMALAGWGDPSPMSLAQVEARIERLTKEQGDDLYNYLICLLDDERPIGEVMLVDIDRRNGSAELGIFMEPMPSPPSSASASKSCASSASGSRSGPRTRAPDAPTRRQASCTRQRSQRPLRGRPIHQRRRDVDPPRRVVAHPSDSVD